MRFRWGKPKEMATPVRDSEAVRAKERALLDQRAAETDLTEIRERAGRSRDQRDQNHFGPLIYNAMRPK